MRQLKFRVWDKVDYMATFTLRDLQERKVGFTDDCPVMQYTGLKDRHGKEIFEGDIVKDKYDTYTIKFSAGSFVMKIHGEHQERRSKHGSYNMTTGVEVLGNIYEHPSLLTSQP